MSTDRTEMEAARRAGLAKRHETREARAVRKAVAEEIALAIEEFRIQFPKGRPVHGQLGVAVHIAREIGSRDPA